jgi:5-methylcytosine-specific restriction endonuclease McrBC GTP-binding regulatory subunit McrB
MERVIMTLDDMVKRLKESHNIILTGAPGTGKTYRARQIAEKMQATEETTEFVQFHPSYDYTDFVEGLRPIQSNEGSGLGFELQPGIFMKFCDKARKAEAAPTQGDYNSDELDKSIEKLREDASEGNGIVLETVKHHAEFRLYVNEGRRLRAKPNNGTSVYSIVPKRIHAFCDEANPKHSDKTLSVYYDPIIKYMKEQYGNRDGVQQNPAKSNVSHNYVFIIDEINRGEISKIFGELFFSIDPGYRGEGGAVSTQYSNMHDDAEYAFAEKFYVPDNVYIIGTMNDIDRSVDTFDFAMRRRFTWIEITAEDSREMLDKGIQDVNIRADAIKRMKSLNEAIIAGGLSRHYQIGAAYFLKLEKLNNDFEALWNYQLEPLLYSYFQGEDDGGKNKVALLKRAYGCDPDVQHD